MAKTCRTCKLRDFYCDEPPGALVHIRRLGADGDDCEYWRKAETPLLEDVLAVAVEELMIPRHTSEERAVGYDLGRAALARYKEEVGDA